MTREAPIPVGPETPVAAVLDPPVSNDQGSSVGKGSEDPGHVPKPSNNKKRNDNGRLDPHCLLLLRHLQNELETADGKTVGVTSCGFGEGVSSIAGNVAVCAARVGESPVLLIDAQPVKSRIAKRFGTKASPGWSDVLTGDASLEQGIQQTSIENLSVIVAGGMDPQSEAKSYNIETVTSLIDRIKERFGFIVMDLPPASERSSCFALAGALDGVVLVIEAEKVRSKVALRAREHFERADVNLLGVVLNKRREHIPNWIYNRL